MPEKTASGAARMPPLAASAECAKSGHDACVQAPVRAVRRSIPLEQL